MRLKQFKAKGKLTFEKPFPKQTLKQAINTIISTPKIKTVKETLRERKKIQEQPSSVSS